MVGINHTYNAHAITFADGRTITPAQGNRFKMPHQQELEKLSEKEREEFIKAMQQRVTIELDTMVDDISFVIDQLASLNTNDPQEILTKAMDLDHIGIFGYSFGGAAAVYAAYKDDRIKAVINMDGPLFGKPITSDLGKPCMLLLAERFDSHYKPYAKELSVESYIATQEQYNAMMQPLRDAMQNFFNLLTHDAYRIILKGSVHGAFTDFELMVPHNFLIGSLLPTRANDIIRVLLTDFFDTYLKNQDKKKLIDAIQSMPEVIKEIDQP